MKIGKLNAGTNLDVLVAEKIMGFEWDENNQRHKLLLWPDEEGTIAAFIFTDDHENQNQGKIEATYLPRFSSNFAAAWSVVEKINQDNNMILQWYNPDGREAYFRVSFGFGITWTAQADTAPLAICRAALMYTVDNSELS